MATAPDPIEGWRFTCFWKTDKHADGLQWEAQAQDSRGGYWTSVFAFVDVDGLHVEDRTQYDGRSYLQVPLAVVDALRELQTRDGLATTEQTNRRER
jgi:hypothetical protein